MKLIAVGYTYQDVEIHENGGTVRHDAIWNTIEAFKEVNPNSTPMKVRITIETVGKRKINGGKRA